MVPLGEEIAGDDVQVITLGAEMVVDDVEQDREAARVARLDQRLQILGPAIGGSGREELHAVIAPVAPPGKLRDRHQLDRGHAELDEIVEPRDRAGEIAALGKRAEMQFVDDHLFPAAARASRYRTSDRRRDR